jgi:hypothetical protein
MITHTRSHIVVWQKSDLINANFAVVLLRPEYSFSLTLFSVFVLSLRGFGKIGEKVQFSKLARCWSHGF